MGGVETRRAFSIPASSGVTIKLKQKLITLIFNLEYKESIISNRWEEKLANPPDVGCMSEK
jgi:hypothetical protein